MCIRDRGRVLGERADSAAPPEPCSLGEVASRLQRPASVGRVLPRLTLPCLQVAEALVALGPAERGELEELLGVAGAKGPEGSEGAQETEGARELGEVLEALGGQALVWPDGDGLWCAAEPLRLVWRAPLGFVASLDTLLADRGTEELRRMLVTLGVPSPGSTKRQRLSALVGHLRDPQRVLSLVAGAPAAARELLERLAAGGGELHLPPHEYGSRPGARWALERGLLVPDPHRYEHICMPVEVTLALRGTAWHAPFDPLPPPVSTTPVGPADVDREASAAATAFTAHATSVLAVCAAAPPALLKSGAGGVGARELSRIGKAARCDDTLVRLALETAYGAGLVAPDGGEVAMTDGYDAWAAQEPAEQFAALLRAWIQSPRTPTRSRGDDGKTLPALAGAPPCDCCVWARDGLLVAARLAPGEGVERSAELGTLIGWYRPYAVDHGQGPAPYAGDHGQGSAPYAALIREAELLGVIARGALSRLGAAARDDNSTGLATVCRELLPAAAKTAHFGADLTAVVTGTPSARLAALLDATAGREAGGTASVWRFGADTVGRALDSGRTAEAIAADLAAVAVGALPQPLTYLIHDTARGHGRVRVATAPCVIHGAEPALLAELAAHRRLAGLGLRQVAPTVLLSRTALDKTLDALRSAGYAPVAEAADGAVRIDKPRRRRATVPEPSPRLVPLAASESPFLVVRQGEAPPDASGVDLTALAAKLLAAPPVAPVPDPQNGVPYATDVEEITATYARLLPLTDVRQLSHAISEGRAVTIEYVAASGNRTVRTISEIDFDPPYLYAWCHLRDDERVFALSRIHGVMPA
ncbi:hypothetical protein ADK38_11150 [Streptomyces varsoviensis]|uniref:Helicase XPB/Ssl2 N-terminal domain-containing protein n=1 Tax=Streptomyces varsoviensis TaxID=67373 RepID=A0ABR5J991_9ACTN|nr:hypothetical protein ADK38_11150 [Streptomyces varsoviensis]